MRPAKDIEATIVRHANTVWRVCCLYFPCEADRQDAFQETFLRYALADNANYEGEEHRKAWLIRVARSRCLDMLKKQKHTVPADDESLTGDNRTTATSDAHDQPGSFASEVMDALRAMTDPPRTPVYLALCEEFTAPEIAQLLDAPVNTVYSWIRRGKQHLREVLS